MKNKQTQETNIIINEIQTKNPYSKDFFFNYKVQKDLICDFCIANKYHCYFLSLKYHEAYPTYIDNRIISNKTLDIIKILFCIYDLPTASNTKSDMLSQNAFNVSLCLNDVSLSGNIFTDDGSLSKGNNNTKIEKLMIDLNFICLSSNVLLVICYKGYDLAQYIYSLSLMDKTEGPSAVDKRGITFEEDLIESICMIDKINKNDATNLLTSFHNIRSISTASSQLISLIPGITEKKKNSINEFFTHEFKK
jgi:hypothetical protein